MSERIDAAPNGSLVNGTSHDGRGGAAGAGQVRDETGAIFRED